MRFIIWAATKGTETALGDDRDGFVLNAVASSLMFLLIGASPLFFLAPLSAILLGEFYARFLQEDAAMLAAMTVYVLCTLLANFTFDTFIPLPLFGLLSVGTLFFGITFTQRDRVHRYGRTQVYLMILVAAVTNLLLSFYLGIPFRFLLAGFLAIILAEAADTEVYQHFISRRWLTRVVTSNAVSIPIDSVTFTLIAFAGTLSLAALGEIIFADILAKTVIGVVAAARLLRQEGGRRNSAGLPSVAYTDSIDYYINSFVVDSCSSKSVAFSTHYVRGNSRRNYPETVLSLAQLCIISLA